MERILSKNLPDKIGEKVLIRGWLNNLRSLGKINFLILRDRGGFMQIVIQDKKEFFKVKNLQPGSVLRVQGEVQKSNQAELGIEIINPEFEIESVVSSVPPVEYTKPDINADLETILDFRTITLRNQKIQAIFRIQGEIAHLYRKYMHDIYGAYEYFGPNMIGASSEGGAEFFKIKYFNHDATLAQSSQLYKQIMVGVNERVFGILPSFRAENSNTVRHLTEFHQMEFEMGFFESWTEIMDAEEAAIKYIIKHLSENCQKEMNLIGTELILAPVDIPFPRITFKQAQEIYLERSGIDERQEKDLSPGAEKELCKYARENFGTDLIFITDWFASKRPFYAFPSEQNPDLTNTMDLLCAGTEITSGGQRRHTYDSMVEGIRSKGMDPTAFEDYLAIFKFGMPPHGGFGLGLERFTLTALRLANIREATLFPSDPRRIASVRIKSKVWFGAENVRNEIIRQLKEKSIPYEQSIHEPTPTSEDSAKVRGTKMEEGVKALILIGKKTKLNYQFNLPAQLKLDMKKVEEITGEKCEFEKPDSIKSKIGIEVGGVPPVGNLFGFKTFFDKRITDEERSAFNCGMQNESIIMKSKDLVELVEPEIGDFVKE